MKINDNTEIEKSKELLSVDEFSIQLMLARKHPWLTRKSNAVASTLALCASEEEKRLIIDLISRLSVFDPNGHHENLAQIGDYIVNRWRCSADATLLLALDDKEVADSSKMVVQQMKGVLAEYGGWTTAQFLTSLGAAVDRVQCGQTIVVVDDFSGSGESIQKKLIWLREKLEAEGKRARLLVAVATAMEASKALICPNSDDYIAIHWIKRGISDHFKEVDLEKAVEMMECIEGRLAKRFGSKKLVDYRFGWRRSEALYCVLGLNPPNNNFPIFWWSKLRGGGSHNPILPRV